MLAMILLVEDLVNKTTSSSLIGAQWQCWLGQHNSHWYSQGLRALVNQRRMCEGYGSRSVCVYQSVYLSVNSLAAIYRVCKSKLWCYTIPYGVPNAWNVWILLKTLCLPVLASFADGKLLTFPKAALNIPICMKGHVLVYTYALYGMLSACTSFSESPAHWVKRMSWACSIQTHFWRQSVILYCRLYSTII